jgi:hypothetical protein
MRDRGSHRLSVLAVVVLGAAIVGSCTDNDDAASFGPDEPVDLAIYFVPTVTDRDITDFLLEVLSKPPVPGREGQAHLDGVQHTSGDYTRKAAYVTFASEASAADRQAVMDVVLDDGRVERVEEDVIPAETPLTPRA